MNIRMLDFVREMRDGKKIYGHIKVQVKDSFECWLVVLKSEKHGYFFKYPSILIEGNFTPALEFTKIDFLKEANNQLREQFKQHYG